MTKAPSPELKPLWRHLDVRSMNEGWAIVLDERTAKTPGGGALILPTPALADAVADEWRAAEGRPQFVQMPLTRLAFTAIDATPPARAEVVAEVRKFAASDLLCYFAEYPDSLIARQQQAWRPWLDWAADELGVRLAVSSGVLYHSQAETSLDAATAAAAALDDFALTGLAFGAAIFGSAILAFAVQRRALSGGDAFALSRLDEAFQEEHWGIDAEAGRRTIVLQRDADCLDRWFAALQV